MQIKILHTLPFLAWGVQTWAQADLVISYPSELSYAVYLDGKLQNAVPHRGMFVLRQIPEGNYQLTIQEFAPQSAHAAANQARQRCTQIAPTYVEINRNECVFYQLIPNTNGDCKITFQSKTPLAKTPSLDGYTYQAQGVKSALQEATPAVGTNTATPAPNALESKREGTFRMVEWTDESGKTRLVPADSVAVWQKTNKNDMADLTATPTPENMNKTTEEIVYRWERDANTGAEYVVEDKTIITKTLVERNGEKMLKTNRQQVITPLPYTCPPMRPSEFEVIAQNIGTAANTLTAAIKFSANQCFAPAYMERILNMLPNDNDRRTFAAAAKGACAHSDCDVLAKWLAPTPEPVVEQPQPDTVAHNSTTTQPTNPTDTASTQVAEPTEEPRKGKEGKKAKKEKKKKEKKKKQRKNEEDNVETPAIAPNEK